MSWRLPPHPGGVDDYFRDEILQFHLETEEWSLAGHMMEARYEHAVSTINFEDVREYCNFSGMYVD